MAKRTDVKTTEEKVQALTEHAFRKLNRAKSALLTAEKKGEEYVKKHPVKATAIAVGIGVAIGARPSVFLQAAAGQVFLIVSYESIGKDINFGYFSNFTNVLS